MTISFVRRRSRLAADDGEHNRAEVPRGQRGRRVRDPEDGQPSATSPVLAHAVVVEQPAGRVQDEAVEFDCGPRVGPRRVQVAPPAGDPDRMVDLGRRRPAPPIQGARASRRLRRGAGWMTLHEEVEPDGAPVPPRAPPVATLAPQPVDLHQPFDGHGVVRVLDRDRGRQPPTWMRVRAVVIVGMPSTPVTAAGRSRSRRDLDPPRSSRACGRQGLRGRGAARRP